MRGSPRSPDGLRRSAAGRRSAASRLSQSVATRLSIVGLSETPREGNVSAVAINTLCNVMGAGVLSLPLAMYRASIGLGLFLMMYVALMSAYAVYCLVVGCDATGRYSVTEVMAFALFPPRSFATYRCIHRGNSSSSSSAAEGDVESAASYLATRQAHAMDELRRRQRRRVTTVLVELIIFLSNYGTLIIYAKVIADSIPPVVATVFQWEGILVHSTFWLVVSGIIFFMLSCARNMQELKWSSLLGFLTILYIVVAVVYRYYTAVHDDYPSVPPEAKGELVWMGFPLTALRTISTYGVAFGYHFNVPYFYKELRQREPAEMMRSVHVAFPIIVACYAATGFFGYITFGDAVSSRRVGGNIVSNYSEDDTLMNVGRLGLFAHFACVFPIVSICCRRGLHRLAMTALTWSEQSEMMELAAGLGEPEAPPPSTLSPPSPPVYAEETTETTTLLPSAATTALDVVDLDRDVGSPDDTTRFAIVVEALLLVSTTVLLAGTVSGISIVIDVIGTLFGVFLILIAPGIIGLCVFSAEYVANQSSTDAADGDIASATHSPLHTSISISAENTVRYGVRYARVKRALCVVSAVTGIAFTLVGSADFIYEYFIAKKA